MEQLKKLINEKGIIENASILKVDSFINQQIDPELMAAIGKEFANYFKKYKFDKIVTIESSGIAPAVFTGLELGVPVVFARKLNTNKLNSTLEQSDVYSYTKDYRYTLTIPKEFINEGDNILFIDDFLANGQSLIGIHEILTKRHANFVGAGIVIEKTFQTGIDNAESLGIDVYALAKIKKLYADHIEFEE